MTLDEFFEALEKERWRRWQVDATGGVRARFVGRVPCCPLTAVVRRRHRIMLSIDEPYRAGRLMAMATEDVTAVKLAADGTRGFEVTRARILAALGLPEEAP